MRILLIEDNVADARLVSSSLTKACVYHQLECVTHLTAGLEKLATMALDVVLTDLSLPDSSGLETVAALCERSPHPPIIVLTSLADEAASLAMLDAGAQDYLLKDHLNADTLMRSIRYSLHRHEVISENLRLLQDVNDAKNLLEKKNHRLKNMYKAAQEFVDHVSHEFRTPLSVIKEYASLIADGIVGGVNLEQRRMLNVIDDRTDDLNTMVDDMLDMSKQEAGLLCAWRKPCDVRDVLDNVRTALDRKALTRSVTLDVQLDDDLPLVYCDPEKAGRVIVNLAVNAIKFAGQPGQVSIWAQARPASDEVVIGVSDNGPGISEENRQKLCKRFTQLDHSMRVDTKGFGLGLSIAKELIDLNLGTLSVETALGEGSTFSFSLPIAAPPVVVSRYLSQLHARRKLPKAVSLMIATTSEPVAPELTHDVDRFLNYLMRRNDLIFKVDDDRWLFVLPTPPIELGKFIERAGQTREDANRNRPRAQLPPIEFEIIGSWRGAQSHEAILDQIRQLCPVLEGAT